eukprot:1081092-Prymnesium_polylepis.1
MRAAPSHTSRRSTHPSSTSAAVGRALARVRAAAGGAAALWRLRDWQAGQPHELAGRSATSTQAVLPRPALAVPPRANGRAVALVTEHDIEKRLVLRRVGDGRELAAQLVALVLRLEDVPRAHIRWARVLIGRRRLDERLAAGTAGRRLAQQLASAARRRNRAINAPR